MRRAALLLALGATACSASPTNPINQTGLIRAMDRFFSGGAINGYTPPPGQRQKEIWVKAPPDQPVVRNAQAR